ncbi:hypothetical protein J113_12775 [Mycobacterium tuberculosis CAS/NITR204]|uniref:CNNM transmembrane domain-containing protein n=1 Tax=Mycobacterium tuberculosis CAS/NITR204 TaxID=1310114 RepID=R4M6H9_MYCTX|nr:hypothetical protein J113_12775 [Mycobacterium tuberculosis CAS/NITR204]
MALTAGTGVFVAAEFSLTALDRSTVEANARGGTSRDRFIQRAHHRLSFQLSGAQLGISITTLATGYLTEPLVAELPHPGLVAVGMSDRVADGLITFFALVIVTSLSMVFGELVPKYLAVARPLRTARSVVAGQVLFSLLLTPAIRLTNGAANWIVRRLGIEPAEELRSARTPQELVSLVRSSARSGALDDATAWLCAARAVRRPDGRGADDATVEDRGAADRCTIADLVAAAAASGFSRFPVVEGDLDATVGIVHVKQVFEVPPGDRAHTLRRRSPTGRGGALDARRRCGDGAGPRQCATDRHGCGRVRRHRGHGNPGGLDRRDRGRRPRRTRRCDTGCGGSRQRMAGLGSATHRRGGQRHRLSSPRRSVRDDRRVGASRARPHPGGRRNGRADCLGPGRTSRRLDAVVSHRDPDGRAPDRLVGVDQNGRPCRPRVGAGPLMDVLSAVLLALLLIGANAFFVGAEFALISARRTASKRWPSRARPLPSP